MPHRVVDFLRSSTHSLGDQVSHFAKKSSTGAPRRKHSPNGTGKGHRGSERSSSTLICEADLDSATAPPYELLAANMSDSRASSVSSDSHKDAGHQHHHQHHHHRISFPGLHIGRLSRDASTSLPATLDWKLESPPVVMYGDPDSSSGALVSGQLFLNVREEGLEIESFQATLNVHVTQKRPFTTHCAECANQHTELKRWELIQQPLAMAQGTLHASPLRTFALTWECF